MGERGAFRAIVKGRVQGVGFRWSVAREARRVGVTGWVCNLPDGTVEAEVEGSPEQLAEMRRYLGEGPSLARVDELTCDDLAEPPGFDEFMIRQDVAGRDDA